MSTGTSRHWEAYQKYIHSDAWKRRKARFFKVYFRSCVKCGSKSKSITLHHMTYEHMGDEPDRDMVPLCGHCHEAVHRFHEREGGTLLEDSLKFLDGKRPKRRYMNWYPKPKQHKASEAQQYYRY